jgi:hypothetical protein
MSPSCKQCKYVNIKFHTLFSNLKKLRNMILTKKLLLIDIFRTIYHSYHLHIPFDNTGKNRLKPITTKQRAVISNLLLNHKKFAKTLWTKKLRLLHSFPTPYYLHYFDKRLENSAQITVRRFWVDPKYRIFKITRKPYRIWKNLQRYKSCAFSVAFQRYIICTILISGLETKSKILFIRFLWKFPIFEIKFKRLIIWNKLEYKKVADFH